MSARRAVYMTLWEVPLRNQLSLSLLSFLSTE
jgi:hypothetical protein